MIKISGINNPMLSVTNINKIELYQFAIPGNWADTSSSYQLYRD